MADGERSVYCGNCGSIVLARDRFCGVCGAGISSDAQDASPTREIPTLVPPPPSMPGRRRNRKLINGVMVGTLLVFSLVGIGVLALTGFVSGGGLLGGTEGDPAPSQPSGGPSGSPEPTTPPSGPSEPSWMSDEEIAALEGFGRDYDDAMRRGDWEETYSMLDEESRQEFTEEEWAGKQQILADEGGPPAPLESVGVEQEEQVADGPVTVRMSYKDGSDAAMTALIPQVVEDPADSGVPKRLFTEEEVSELDGLPQVLNEGFSPTGDQVAWARKVAEAFTLSVADGRSSIGLEGKMIDKPVADRAQSILSQTEAIEAFEASKPTGEAKG